MNGQINGAETVTKINVNALEAFQSPGSGAEGVIVDGKIFWQSQDITDALSANKMKFSIKNLTELPKVRIIYGYVGGDDGLFVKAALQDGARGLVYAACGNGSVPEKLAGLLKETVASGVPVAIATRCGGGVVVLSEIMTATNGFIAAGTLNPQKAKILLQLALTKTNNVKEIQKIF